MASSTFAQSLSSTTTAVFTSKALSVGIDDNTVLVQVDTTAASLSFNIQGSLDNSNWMNLTVVPLNTGIPTAAALTPSNSTTTLYRVANTIFIPYIRASATVGTGNVSFISFTEESPSVLYSNVSGTAFNGAANLTTTSANALTAGLTGTTNPAFNVDCSVGSQATGINIIGRAAAAGVTLATTSSGADEDLLVAPKGAGGVKVTTTSANGLAVGRQGSTNPVLAVACSAATVVTGLSITGAAAAAGLALAVTSSGTDENLTINAKGAGTVGINSIGTGLVVLGRGVLKMPILGLTKLDINTQNAAPTIAQWLGGYITHNSQTGAGTLTTPTGANISGGVAGVAVGDSFLTVYQNRGNQTVTLTAGDGNVTIKGTAAIATLKTSLILFSNTGASTWDACQVLGA